jgi:hypothetical protein
MEPLAPAPVRPPRSKKSGWFAFLVVLIVGTGAYIALVWHQHQVDELVKRNEALMKQVQNLPRATATPTTTVTATPAPASFSYTSAKGAVVKVFVPENGGKLTSPAGIIGEVPSGWAFEAQFPVELQTAAGAKIASGPGHVQGDWTQAGLSPFTSSFEFTVPKGETTGFLVIRKDNPSGAPANDDSVKVPVKF